MSFLRRSCCCISLKSGSFIIVAFLSILQILEIMFLIYTSTLKVSSDENNSTSASENETSYIYDDRRDEILTAANTGTFRILLHASIAMDFLGCFCLICGVLALTTYSVYVFITMQVLVLASDIANLYLIDPKFIYAYSVLIVARLYFIIIGVALVEIINEEIIENAKYWYNLTVVKKPIPQEETDENENDDVAPAAPLQKKPSNQKRTSLQKNNSHQKKNSLLSNEANSGSKSRNIQSA